MKTIFPASRRAWLSALSLHVVLIASTSAAEFIWNNDSGDNDYFNTANWSDGTLPQSGSNNYAVIDRVESHKAILSRGSTDNLAGIRIGYDDADGEFHQMGGKANFSNLGPSRFGRDDKVGTYRLSGGTAFLNALQLGLGNSGTGKLIMSGGEMTIVRGAATGTSSIIVDFGSGSAEGLVEISGGSLQTRTDVIIGDNGTFTVLGSDATHIGIGTYGSLDGQWIQEAGGTLRCRIADTPQGITPITVADKGDASDGDGNVTFAAGSLLDIGFIGASVEGEWDLMTWDGVLTDNGLTFAPGVDPAVWSFDFVDTNSSGSPDTLRVKTNKIVETTEFTYDENPTNVNLSAISGAYSASASANDAINDSSPRLSAEVQTTGPNFGSTGLNDGTATGTGNILNTYYDNGKFPATVTFGLDTDLVPTGYDITGITSIAGWEKSGANLANQSYEIWISTVGDPDFHLLHTVDYKPFTSDGLNGNTASTKVSLSNTGGILANGIDEIRFIFQDDGEDFGQVDGTVYQEIDIFSSTSPPPVLVPSEMFGDSMVLQRDMEVPIWGSAPAEAQVTVQLDGNTLTATTASTSGDWIVRLPTHSGDGGLPHTLTISTPGEADVVFQDVVFGDVYIASGQSNMARNLTGIEASAEITSANYPLIRQIKMAEATSSTEKDSPTIQYAWTPCSPPIAGNFCAVGYYFAKELQAATGEPVGILFSAWGGRTIERFINPAGLAAVPSLSGILQNREAGKISGYSDIYNAMIAPMSPYAVRGTLWYQGEQNGSTGDGDIYQLKMRALIRGWREKWGQSEFSFYWVQLPNFVTDQNWPVLRDAQRRALTEPNTGMAIIIDAGDNNDVHPSNKQDPGERLAKLALRAEYEQPDVASGPLIHTTIVEGSQIRVYFDHVGSGLLAGTKAGTSPVEETGGALENFEIAGADKVFVEGTASIEGSTVLVSSPAVPSPRYVRYCYTNAPEGGNKLYNQALLPASPFRTDEDYELEVDSGEGDGKEIKVGELRTITADSPPSGMTFARWIGAASELADPNSASTTVTMPDHDLYLVATYQDSGTPSYSLTIHNGYGSGSSQGGSIINIEAHPPASGLIFDHWSGDVSTLVNPEAPSTTLRMPSRNAILTAVFRPASTAGDGVPDSWRSLHFGGNGVTPTSSSSADADPDEDGQSNLQEFEAGTDPNDPTSVLQLSFFQNSVDRTSLQFPTRAFNRYLLQSSRTLASGSWIPESNELVGSGFPFRFELGLENECRKFYRVRSIPRGPSLPDGLNSLE